MINESCTNKNCVNKAVGKTATKTTRTSKTKAVKTGDGSIESKAASKPTKVRKASKCITYNLNDLKDKEENV